MEAIAGSDYGVGLIPTGALQKPPHPYQVVGAPVRQFRDDPTHARSASTWWDEIEREARDIESMADEHRRR